MYTYTCIFLFSAISNRLWAPQGHPHLGLASCQGSIKFKFEMWLLHLHVPWSLQSVMA